tara:strand:- start:6556 stop:6909 length:354 start_codon:yes stop_codon:yes gene_type:complete
MKHTLFDLRGCLFDNLLNEEEFIRDSLVNAAIIAKSPYLKVETHKFEPQGVTGFAMLKDSHISIHTWPEYSIAKCDIFTCNPNSKPKDAIEYLKERFHATEVVKWTCDRSSGIDVTL